MRYEYYEHSATEENPIVRRHILLNPAYSDLLAYCKAKSIKLNVVVRVIYEAENVTMIGHVFDVANETPAIIEAFTEKMSAVDFENRHEYYLFGLNSIEMEAY